MNDENKTPYQKLSPEARQRNIDYATKYNKERTTRITIKYKNEDFEEVQKYIETCGAVSNNSFFKEAVKYAIENDFKGVNGD